VTDAEPIRGALSLDVHARPPRRPYAAPQGKPLACRGPIPEYLTVIPNRSNRQQSLPYGRGSESVSERLAKLFRDKPLVVVPQGGQDIQLPDV
jgi:hypothetical protein